MSVWDYICITATYTGILTGSNNDDRALIERGFSEQQIKSLNKVKKKIDIRLNGMIFTKPLKDFQYPAMGYLLLILENYEMGNLPFEGPISEQPAQIIEMLTALRNIQTEHRIKIERQNLESFKRKQNK